MEKLVDDIKKHGVKELLEKDPLKDYKGKWCDIIISKPERYRSKPPLRRRWGEVIDGKSK